MTDRLSRLEARLDELARSVEELASRVASLEGGTEPLARAEERAIRLETLSVSEVLSVSEAVPEERGSAVAFSAPAGDASGWGGLALVGRTLIVMGGAYLIRWLTESGAVPAHVGLMLGVAYAFVWLISADRAAAAGRHKSAAFHGASFALIAEPLAWEAAGRFGIIGASGGAAGVALFTGCALAIAWWRRLRPVAWIAVLGAIFSSWALMASIEPVLPAVAVLVAVTIAADWLAMPPRLRNRGAPAWRFLPWVPALATDVTLAVIVVEAVFGRPDELPSGPGMVWLLLALFVGSAGSLVLRALLDLGPVATTATVDGSESVADQERGAHWRPRWFDLAHGPATAVIGYWGAWGLAGALIHAKIAGIGVAIGLGVASAVAAAACYGAALPLLPQRPGRRPAYLLLTSLGLILAVGAGGMLLDATGRAAAWSVLAVAGAWLAGRRRTVTVGLHAFVYALLAAVSSGLLVEAGYALATDPGRGWPTLSPVAVAVLAALAVAASLRLPAESPFWGRAARIPKLLLLAALVWAASGALLAIVLPWLAAAPSGPSLVAAVRTGFVALLALALAWLSRYDRFREARWLVYAVLIAGAVKLIVEDLRLGRPGELFVALAVYGGALILAPRLTRSGGESRAEVTPPAA